MDANVPMTVICSKASEDIRTLLEGIMKEHNISADLMCMIIRDAASHFERMRANDYNNAIIQLTASVDALKKEEAKADVNYLCRKMKFMQFPSDQANFKKGIGVCALKKSPIGYYVARIHTYFDTRCRKENIDFLTKAMKEFVESL